MKFPNTDFVGFTPRFAKTLVDATTVSTGLPMKMPVPSVVTVSGNTISVISLFLNASLSIVCTVEKSKDPILLFSNAESPIDSSA